MPNYQEGKIYKIYNTINDDIYVGSTTRKLCERMGEHRSRVKYRDKHKPLSQSILEHGVENFFIELIEKCPCNDKDELRKREGKYIREMKCVNKCIAGRTKKEWTYDNRFEIRKRVAKWQKENKDKVNASHKKYRDINKEKIKRHKKQTYTCECGITLQLCSKASHERSKKHQSFVQTQK